ncbi:MAG: recombination regulator RecX [Clostridiales bacterium]|nr:recombination regulator RecX [Clostridiales bacterium]
MGVREKAVSYLNIKPRTKQQVIKYLRGKGFGEDEIHETLKELEEYHYIDDARYCRLYFEYGFEKGRGTDRIKRELAEKGVAHDVIEIVYEELDNVPDQFEAAMRIGRQVVSGIDVHELDYHERRKIQARIGRRIVSRGYSQDIAYKVMKRLV